MKTVGNCFTTDRGIVLRINKEYLGVNKKNWRTQIEKWAKKHEWVFTKKKAQMTINMWNTALPDQ